jgi:MFS family permease
MRQGQVVVDQVSATKRQATLGLIAVFATHFVSTYFLRGTSVVAPRIAGNLNGMALYSWSLSLSALASAFVTLTFGKLSDMYGRRIIMMLSLAFFLAGAILAAVSQTYVFYIVAIVILFVGRGALPPLCFSVVGDLFAPAERSKWSGLLSIPAGIASTACPVLVGMVTDHLSWRYFFWILAPLVLISGILVLFGVPSFTRRTAHKVDVAGIFWLGISSSTMIIGFSWAGAQYPWTSFSIIGLLSASLVSWVMFIWIETKAQEPVVDPQVLTNRTFLTAAGAVLLSFFGLVGIQMYYPLFLQGVQGISATLTGQIITPYNMLMSFMGVPAGYLLARTRRYKWMFTGGYALLAATMFVSVTFNAGTAVWLGVVITALAGLGFGAIPTINTLVVQFAVPKKLLGVAVGAIYFCVSLGGALAPAILGSAMNASYAKTLQASLPAEINRVADRSTLESLINSRVLLSPESMAELRKACNGLGSRGPKLFDETVQAIRGSLEASLKTVFLIGAVTMLAAFLLIFTIPEVSMDVEVRDKRAGNP